MFYRVSGKEAINRQKLTVALRFQVVVTMSSCDWHRYLFQKRARACGLYPCRNGGGRTFHLHRHRDTSISFNSSNDIKRMQFTGVFDIECRALLVSPSPATVVDHLE